MNTKTILVIISLVVGASISALVLNKTSGPTHPITNSSEREPSMSMAAMMQHMTQILAQKTSDDLDKTFLENMIIHHQGAVDTATIIVNNSDREELKAFAQEIIDVQDREIQMMQMWIDQWFINKKS